MRSVVIPRCDSDIATAVGITIGAVQRIIHELEEAGYLRQRACRTSCNRYSVIDDKPLRHPLEDQHTLHDLIVSLEQQIVSRIGHQEATLGRRSPGPARPSVSLDKLTDAA
ncbi:MAG: hypothetical protein R2706_08370 [Acidimicrobiales bacterium]